MTKIFNFCSCCFADTNLIWTKESFTRTPEPPAKREARIEEKNHQCVKRTNTNFSDRIKNYPFNLTTQIQLVSFKGEIGTSELQSMKDLDSLPGLNDTVCYSRLTEVKNLSFAQVNKLTDILYNYGFSRSVYIGGISLCCNPRNAILFLDTAGDVFEYIEICFECSKTKESSDTISLGDMCD